MYSFIANVVKFAAFIFIRPVVKGKENLPTEDGYVIACTHTGWVDGLVLGTAILPQKIHYMAKKELFKTRFLNWFFTTMNAFPVDRDNPGPSAIKVPFKLLRAGKIVGIFPSGTRSEEEGSLKKGAVTIAMRAKKPLIPAAYVGPNNFADIKAGMKAKLIFGEPLAIHNGETGEEAAEKLNEAFKRLTQEIS